MTTNLTRVQLNYANRARAILMGWEVFAWSIKLNKYRGYEVRVRKAGTGMWNNRDVLERWQVSTVPEHDEVYECLAEAYNMKFRRGGIWPV